MKRHTFIAASLMVFASAASAADAARPATDAASKQSQMISRVGAQPTTQGPAQYFTGNVRVTPLFPANDSTPMTGHSVTFEPGARSAWHTHPTGQHLIVTAGVGWSQESGGPVTEIRAGDVVWCPPGVKHWHGASKHAAMTHLALTGIANGENVEWMEKVTDEQYRK